MPGSESSPAFVFYRALKARFGEGARP